MMYIKVMFEGKLLISPSTLIDTDEEDQNRVSTDDPGQNQKDRGDQEVSGAEQSKFLTFNLFVLYCFCHTQDFAILFEIFCSATDRHKSINVPDKHNKRLRYVFT